MLFSLLKGLGTRFEKVIGSVKVVELDWSSDNKLDAVVPPYDFVIAADCIYHESHIPDFLDTILKLTNPKSTGKSQLHPFFGPFWSICLPFPSFYMSSASSIVLLQFHSQSSSHMWLCSVNCE